MTHQQRPWIKVQLSINAQAQEAAVLVKGWKLQHQAAAQIVRAVRLYAALCNGDLSLLEDYFPGLGRTTGPSLAVSRRAGAIAPAITYTTKSELEELSEALDGLGLEVLDFGGQ